MGEKTIKLEHIAVASNSEDDSDLFFINLLGLEKIKSFIVKEELMHHFFRVDQDQIVVRYENEMVSFEVFIVNDDSNTKDVYTHICLVIKERDLFKQKAEKLGFEVIQVPRKDSENYYLFIKDHFCNLYEIKSP